MAERESKAPTARQRFSGETAAHEACEASRAFAELAGVDSKDAHRLCILVEELVLNAFEHGGAAVAELALELDGRNICIELTDSGVPFDLEAASAEPVAKERGGGAGLAIVRSWARVIAYDRVAEVNRLTLVMPLRC